MLNEYLQTVPSSAPVTKKSFVAATQVWDSCGTSMLTGSASEPVVKTRITLFNPTVISFLPLGV